MIDTANTTLNQRPKAFNAVGMDVPIDVDFRMMVYPFVPVANPSHSVISGELVSIENSTGSDILGQERNESRTLNIGITLVIILPFRCVAPTTLDLFSEPLPLLPCLLPPM